MENSIMKVHVFVELKIKNKPRSEWTEREQCNIKYLHFQVRFYQF